MPTILIVDDDQHARSLLARVLGQASGLKELGLKIVFAGDGVEGLEVLAAERPDFVISDLLMPRMDGFEFCTALRTHEHGKKVGLAVTSGLYREPHIHAMVKEKYQGVFFTKPYQVKEIADAAVRFFAGTRAAAAARPGTTLGVPQENRPPGKGAKPPPIPPPSPPPESAEVELDDAGLAHMLLSDDEDPGIRKRPDTLRISGSLGDKNVPTLLLELAEKKATGHLDLKRAGVEKRVDLVAGHVMNVTSNQRQETLGHFLVSRGSMTEEQHRTALQRAQETGEKLGKCLVDMGVMSSAELMRALVAQSRYKLTSALRWDSGTFTYQDDRELMEATKGNAIDVPSLVFVGLRNTSRPEVAARAANRLGTGPIQFNERGKRLDAAATHAFGDGLMASLSSGIAVSKLLDDLGGESVLPAVEALVLSGCVILPAASADQANVVADPLDLGGLSRRFAIPGNHSEIDAEWNIDDGDPAPLPTPDPVPSARKKRSTLGGMEPIRASNPRIKRPSFSGFDPMEAPPAAKQTTEPLAGSLYDLIFGSEMGDGADMPLFDVSAADVGPAPARISVPRLPAFDSHDGLESLGEDMMADAVVAKAEEEADSGIVDFQPPEPEPIPEDPKQAALREALLAEFLRIQGKDWYSVLGVRRDADTRQIQRAHDTLAARYALDAYAPYNLGSDYSKLEEIHAAYRRARENLLDVGKRAAHDKKLRASTGMQAQPQAAFSAEMEFKRGEERLGAGDHDTAVAYFRTASRAEPQLADYHAALGWALYLRSEATAARAGDPHGSGYDRAEGLEEIARALGIDPDHGAAHEYVGRILAPVGQDPERAADHLERALEAHPVRLGAVDALEELLVRQGEVRRLEQRFRALIHRIGETNRELAASLWRRLGDLYRTQLKDTESAHIAYQCAARLAPADGKVLLALDDLLAGNPDRFDDRTEALRARWRIEPADPTPGKELMHAALANNQAELAMLAAAALVARHVADDEARDLYQRYRPRFLVRVQRPLDAEVLATVRHPDDDPSLNALFAALEPIAQYLDPLSMEDLEITPEHRVAEDQLPESFRKVRSYVAEVLSVEEPPVMLRRDFGEQLHVGALEHPVLLVGPDLLRSEDRIQLCFAMARAMTYLFGGRGLAGSRPARFLKAMFLACMSLGQPDAAYEREPADVQEMMRLALEALGRESAAYRGEVANLAVHIAQGRNKMNLTLWARSLARTSDRLGLLLAGDPVAAARGAAAMGTADAVDDLLDFALSAAHIEARARLGISIDV